MKRGLITAGIIGVVVGYAIAVGSHGEQAFGQQPQKPVVWEYRVEKFYGKGVFVDDEPEVEFTGQLNKIAGEGWEYVGPVANRQPADHSSARSFAGFVAFRRPKR